MFIVHVDLTAKPGFAGALTAAYCDAFCPAVATQPGFCETRLLLRRSPAVRAHRLVIVFETEELQKQWVATALHKEVWAKMEPTIAELSVNAFESVDRGVSVPAKEDEVHRPR